MNLGESIGRTVAVPGGMLGEREKMKRSIRQINGKNHVWQSAVPVFFQHSPAPYNRVVVVSAESPPPRLADPISGSLMASRVAVRQNSTRRLRFLNNALPSSGLVQRQINVGV